MSSVVRSEDDLLQTVSDVAELTAVEQYGAYFGSRPDLISRASVQSLCAAVVRLIGVDVEQALRLSRAVRWLAEQVGDDISRARSARASANALHSTGEMGRAQEMYERALAGFLASGSELEAAITRSSSLLNLAYLGDYERVYSWHEAASGTFDRLGDSARRAVLEHNFANILYRQDRWEPAMERYRVALASFQQLNRSEDAAICLRNIAVCHISLHAFGAALQVYEECRAYCREHGLSRVASQVDYNIAYLYYLRGEYTRAIQLYGRARRASEVEKDEYHLALCDLDQAEIYLELNLVSEAAELAEAAEVRFSRLQLSYELAKAVTNRALAKSRRGEYEAALRLLSTARDMFVKEENRLWPALIDFYLGVVLSRQGHPREAIEKTRQAHATFSAVCLGSRAAMCELLLAELWLRSGNLERARKVCLEALERLVDLDLPALEHRACLVLGKVAEAAGDLKAALDAYERAHGYLERLRSQLQGEDLKIAFFQDKQAVYEGLLCLTLNEGSSPESSARAFDFITRAKSRGLADLLAFRVQAVAPRSAAQEELTATIRSLREELSWLYRQTDQKSMLDIDRAHEEALQLGERARQKEAELLHFLRELRSHDRELSSLQGPTSVAPEELRAVLPPAAALLEFFIARGRILVCVLDQNRLEIVDLGPMSRVRQLHRFLQLQLARVTHAGGEGALPPLAEATTNARLEELYRRLIVPLEIGLEIEHLVIAPHGFLHYLPFQALFDGERYLIDRFSLSYSPSGGVFRLCAANETDFEERSLVIGVADERAPDIEGEVEAVARSLPNAALYLGKEASEEVLRSEGRRCRFIHIATHGMFRRDNPMFSAIQLGTSRLSLFDLYDLRLNAELVVLSGCGTGLNAVLGGDELVGLTRGLLYAGAGSVLVTLWDVHDASTASFMSSFYRHLRAGCSRAEALREAMGDLRRCYPHPYYWAPFILVGQPA